MATPASQVKRSTGKVAAAALRDGDDAIDLKKLLRALQSVRDGDFSVRLPSDKTGLAGKLADAFNDIVAQNQRWPMNSSAPDRTSARTAARGIASGWNGASARGAQWKVRSTRSSTICCSRPAK